MNEQAGLSQNLRSRHVTEKIGIGRRLDTHSLLHGLCKAKIDRIVQEAGFVNHNFVIAPMFYLALPPERTRFSARIAPDERKNRTTSLRTSEATPTPQAPGGDCADHRLYAELASVALRAPAQSHCAAAKVSDR
jgi:hypothetical protein